MAVAGVCGCSAVVAAVAVAIIAMAARPIAPMARPEEVPDSNTEQLPAEFAEWRSQGRYVTGASGHRMFVLDVPCNSTDTCTTEAVAVVHGFPTSSFDWRHALPLMMRTHRVVLVDHVGHGLSDKPPPGVSNGSFSYSVAAHAENLLSVWRTVGLKRAHVVAHDMGDTVLTELLARLEAGMLPVDFDAASGFWDAGVTFTNGGLQVDHINYRVSQLLLMAPLGIGEAYARIAARAPPGVLAAIASKQMGSLWGRTAAPDPHELQLMAAGMRLGGGTARMRSLFSYIHDRYASEARYIRGLRLLSERRALPWRMVWFDGDAVSPMAIPCGVEDKTGTTGEGKVEVVRGPGHWAMLEDPSGWVDAVLHGATERFDCADLHE